MAWAPVAGRALGLLVMAALGWQILGRELDFNSASGPLRFIHGIDLVIHEAGHTFAFFLPRFLYVLGGSALQVILPAVCAWTFLTQRQIGSFAVALFWTGESVTDVAIYMADAKKRALPLRLEAPRGGDPPRGANHLVSIPAVPAPVVAPVVIDGGGRGGVDPARSPEGIRVRVHRAPAQKRRYENQSDHTSHDATSSLDFTTSYPIGRSRRRPVYPAP